MKKILITGGPVHAYLDAVKIITNKFKGGLISELAETFNTTGFAEKHPETINNIHITYLTAKGSKEPDQMYRIDKSIEVIYHDGFDDYFKKVIDLSKEMDAVILGAAVANLIPKNPLKGKFPSHNYKVGDTIPIEFTIAPRVIDEIKKVNPKCHLFGFKLLSGVPHEELIHAAYEIVLSSKATAVFANDAKDLNTKFAVTKERAEHQMNRYEMASFIWKAINDEYYKTEVTDKKTLYYNSGLYNLKWFLSKYENEFTKTPEGYIFGTVAVRMENGAFFTTGRGKSELDDIVYVNGVDHEKKIVYSVEKKASLNAPLLDNIFKNNIDCAIIVHLHKQNDKYPTFDYAPPGTVRDSIRNIEGGFNIRNHGCFLLFEDPNRMD